MTDDAHGRDTALAEIRALIAATTFDRKVNEADRRLDLIARCLQISRAAGLPDAEVVAMVRNSLDRVLDDVLPPPRRVRRRFLPWGGRSTDKPRPAVLDKSLPPQLDPPPPHWAPPKPPDES
jgi:hypothetical protein